MHSELTVPALPDEVYAIVAGANAAGAAAVQNFLDIVVAVNGDRTDFWVLRRFAVTSLKAEEVWHGPYFRFWFVERQARRREVIEWFIADQPSPPAEEA